MNEARIYIQAIYATLLKINLLNRQRVNIFEKLHLLFNFFQEEIGIFLAREAFIACLHFTGRTGKFLSFKKDSVETQKNTLASAWDLFLLRLPEIIISNEKGNFTSVYYVCTAEKALQDLGRMCLVRRVSSLQEGTGTIPTSIGFRTDILSQQVGDKLTSDFASMCDQIQKASSSRSPVDLEKILYIVSGLEQQI